MQANNNEDEADLFEDAPRKRAKLVVAEPTTGAAAPRSPVKHPAQQQQQQPRAKRPSNPTSESATPTTATTTAIVEEEEEAFFKLQGVEEGGLSFVRYITTYPCMITLHGHSCAIDFNSETGLFEMEIPSTITGQVIRNGEPVLLPSTNKLMLRGKDAVRLGEDCQFYVLFPEVEKPKKSYAELVIEVLKEHEPTTLSCRELAYCISQRYDYYNLCFGSADKLSLLVKACQSAISKSDKICSIPLGHSGRVQYQLGSKRQ